ncbi:MULTISPECIES: PilW family protein [unclassified Duganella]|uniref:PilW family protein n=1 Tax=unclassified Duganella TaxID=2636909 RepID=UPI000885E732|nr:MULTISPECIES: PilW family protein [unclassified Duganella]SDH43340.1 type IV pilus assembly protein PilW [Duganella sp. OV458]SDK59150.1 type IV pilus assembly protein PilW [Duganella sp. OV510]
MNAMQSHGWGVVEFLIAIALGLLLTLLASGLLVASGGNYRNHSDNLWLADGGRYAIAVMAQAIRQGAYVNWDSDAAPSAPESVSVEGLDAASISRGKDGISEPLPAVAHGSDVLALRFAGADDSASLNCGGFAVPAGTRGWSIFYVAVDADGEPELRCKYRGTAGWGADAVVRGVESFQVLYGVDLDTPLDGVPNTYLNATAVAAAAAWKRVCSVKLALLLRGAINTRADTVAGQFDLFGPAYAAAHPDDAGVRVDEGRLPPAERFRARRLFSMTVALRNRDG